MTDDVEARIERWRFAVWLLALALVVSVAANLGFINVLGG